MIFSRHFKNEILRHRDPRGCREIIANNPASVMEVDMPTDAILKDLDTDEDYERLVTKNASLKNWRD